MPQDPGAGASASVPDAWHRLKELFHQAVERSAEDRGAFVAHACGGDMALQRELESLLASDAAASSFFDRPAAALLDDLCADTPLPALTAGARLGRYEVAGFLGAGGMSEVYLARDSRLGRDVAIKVIGRRVADPRARARLLQEAQHASNLNHPHICTIHEVNEAGGVPFIVMEHIEGASLSGVLRRAPLPLEDLLRLGVQIADALDHAHARGIIHRDLKSANVIVTPEGRAKVLDFGLATRLSGRSSGNGPATVERSTLAGTLSHMAPEVLLGGAADHRADLWAFGVLLYEMATGALPFRGETPVETRAAIIAARAAPQPPYVPGALRRVIERCLAKDPSARYQRFEEVRTALESLQREPATRRAGLIARVPRARLAAGAAVAALVAAAITMGWSGRPAAIPRGVQTIAVLPFTAGAGGAGEDYFLEGVTEGLIADLGTIESLRVTARSSVMKYRSQRGSRVDMARELGADRLVEATLTQSQGRLGAAVRLIDGASGELLWTASFDRSVRDVLALQAQIAREIAAAMNIDAADLRGLTTVRAVDPAVHEAYLKGRYHWNLRTEASLQAAIDHFNAAIALDPTYAEAHAALADCFNQLGTLMVGTGSPREMRPRARAAATRALQIDADLAQAHATLGYINHYDLEWEAGERHLRRAIELNPSYPLAHVWYANLLASRRRFEEAVREVTLARDLDPLSLIVNTNVGWTLILAGRGEEAVAQLRATLDLDPGYLQARWRLAHAYGSMRRFDEAIREFEPVIREGGRTPANVATMAQHYAAAGRTADARRLLDELLGIAGRQYVPPGAIASTYITLGDFDSAFVWLERAYDERSNYIAYLAVESVHDPIRNDPRFVALLRRAGLP